MSENVNRPSVFTCGIRWGNGAPEFTEISLQTKSAILGVANTNSGIFPTIKEGNILALKDGFGIIALGKVSKTTNTVKNEISPSSTDLSWGSFLKKNFIPTEEIESDYGMTENQNIYVVEVKEWIMLDPPIFYKLRSSTVQVRNLDIQQQCWDKIDAYNLSQQKTKQKIKQKTEEELKKEQIEYYLKNTDELIDWMIDSSEIIDKNKSEELLERINESLQKTGNLDPQNKRLLEQINKYLQILENLDPENKKYQLLKQKYTQLQNDKSVQNIVGVFDEKIKTLTISCGLHTFIFLSLITLLIAGLIFIIVSPIPTSYKDTSLQLLFFTKFAVSTTVMMAIFWVARFFNRRIHESIHLKEEYEYKKLLMNSLKSIQNILTEKDRENYLKLVLQKIIENPNYALSRSKSDKIPTEFLQNNLMNSATKNKSDDN